MTKIFEIVPNAPIVVRVKKNNNTVWLCQNNNPINKNLNKKGIGRKNVTSNLEEWKRGINTK